MNPNPKPCGAKDNKTLPEECKQLCCIDCQFLPECVNKWKNGMGNISCKVFKKERWCSAILSVVKNNPKLLKDSPLYVILNPSRRDDGIDKYKHR